MFQPRRFLTILNRECQRPTRWPSRRYCRLARTGLPCAEGVLCAGIVTQAARGEVSRRITSLSPSCVSSGVLANLSASPGLSTGQKNDYRPGNPLGGCLSGRCSGFQEPGWLDKAHGPRPASSEKSSFPDQAEDQPPFTTPSCRTASLAVLPMPWDATVSPFFRRERPLIRALRSSAPGRQPRSPRYRCRFAARNSRLWRLARSAASALKFCPFGRAKAWSTPG